MGYKYPLSPEDKKKILATRDKRRRPAKLSQAILPPASRPLSKEEGEKLMDTLNENAKKKPSKAVKDLVSRYADQLQVPFQVTTIQVIPVKEPCGKTRAFVRIILDECLQITGLRIIEGANGLFVSYPQDISYKGEGYRSCVAPLTKPVRDHIENKVLDAYRNTLQTSPRKNLP
jgi:stage V sporulation protein G